MKHNVQTMGNEDHKDDNMQPSELTSKKPKVDSTENEVQRSDPRTPENGPADQEAIDREMADADTAAEDRSIAIAQKLLAGFAEAVTDISFAHVPVELRLLIARGQDVTKRNTK